jgi:predicted NodU family carbamoyl transferase
MNAKNESVVFGVLQDELNRNRRMQSRYRQEIDQLPKGSLYLRKINHQEYYYLNFRQKDKVVAKYLGKQDEPKIEEVKKRISERKRYEDLLKKLGREEKLLMKALR